MACSAFGKGLGMRIVITGATGNVGTSLIDVLADEPEVDAIVGIARRRPEVSLPKTTWAVADVSRDRLAPLLVGADAVVHLAWIFQPTHQPLTTWQNNVLGSIRVFEAAVRAGVGTLVHASSVGAYSPRPEDGHSVDESWPTHAVPTAAYGREKSYVERVLDVLERDHPEVRVVRLRPGFIFKRGSAAEQRRLFAGPFLPGRLARPAAVPVVPDIPGLCFQALHSDDAGHAYRLALTRDVRGAFNVAADPVIDPAALGRLLGARPVQLPARPLRAAVAAAWRLHLAPASPMLVDLALSLPVMDTSRAREELGWSPASTAIEAIGEFLEGLRAGSGGPTPPLDPHAGGTLRQGEVATGVGERDS